MAGDEIQVSRIKLSVLVLVLIHSGYMFTPDTGRSAVLRKQPAEYVYVVCISFDYLIWPAELCAHRLSLTNEAEAALLSVAHCTAVFSYTHVVHRT